MLVKLIVQLSGDRDGQPWPDIGHVVDLPEPEAQNMITQSQAVAYDGTVESAKKETRPVGRGMSAKPTAKPGQKTPASKPGLTKPTSKKEK